MTGVQRTAWEVGIGIILLLGAYAAWRGEIRTDAIRDLQTHAEDSTHKAKLKAAIDTTALFAHATIEAIAARQAASVAVKRSEALRAATDSAARQASDERERANVLLADSLAKTASLRSELVRLVAATHADSLAAAHRHAADSSAIRALFESVASDSSAIEKGLAAVRSQTARAVSAEKLAALYKAQIPGFLSRHVSISGGYGVLLNQGRILGGPSVSVGFRLWP